MISQVSTVDHAPHDVASNTEQWYVEESEEWYLLSMRWFSLEEERVMQQSSVSISLSF